MPTRSISVIERIRRSAGREGHEDDSFSDDVINDKRRTQLILAVADLEPAMTSGGDFREVRQEEEVADTREHEVNEPGAARKIFAGCCGCMPARYILSVMGFWGFFVMSSLRLNISLAIVAMVNWTAIHNPNATYVPECASNETGDVALRDGEFSWDPETQGIILGSYFYGLAVTQLPGGRVAEMLSAKLVILVGTLSASVVSLLTPFAARLNVGSLVAVQVIKGLGQGIMFPAFSVLVGKWVPLMDRSVFMSSMTSGMPIGAFVAILLSGVLSNSNFLGGWPSVFYVFGAIGCLWCILWAFLIYDTPSEHPWISEKELKYIIQEQRKSLLEKKSSIPLKRIFLSPPVWAFVIAGFATIWTISLYMSVLPTYMGTILMFPIEQNGIMSSFPNLLQALTLFVTSYFCDRVRRKGWARIDVIRKFCITFGLTGFSVCMLGVSFAGCSRSLNVALLVLALGFTGINFAAVTVVPVDMSPTFAGTLTGLMSTLGSLSGVIIPAIVGFLTEEEQTVAEWHIVFYISIGICIIAAIFYISFGSGEMQPWDTLYVRRQKSLSIKMSDSPYKGFDES